MSPPPLPRVLSIAGSDSGGGAGIQADLKAFAACGAHGMTAVTAITAQSTTGVRAIHHVPPVMILEQVRAVAQDIGVDGVKIGMLGTVQTIAAVAEALAELGDGTPVVLDPVMVSESGAMLLEPDARQALVELLLPRATVITPNVPEAAALAESAGWQGASEGVEPESELLGLARALAQLGPEAVLITGGHRDPATDILLQGGALSQIPGERYPDGAAHGSGCTHSAVLAARLAAGDDLLSAARVARELAGRAVRDGLREIGSGPGPVNVLGLIAGPAKRAL